MTPFQWLSYCVKYLTLRSRRQIVNSGKQLAFLHGVGLLWPLASDQTLTLVYGGLVFSVALDVPGKPLVELLVRVEERGHDEMKKSPELRNKARGSNAVIQKQGA